MNDGTYQRVTSRHGYGTTLIGWGGAAGEEKPNRYGAFMFDETGTVLEDYHPFRDPEKARRYAEKLARWFERSR